MASNEKAPPDDGEDDWTLQRDAAKALGDQAFRSGSYAVAIQHYSQAISLDPEAATILSNRSAAYLKNGEKSKALHDAQACVKIGTMGIKGRSRLAAALQSLGRYEPALAEWNLILKEDPNHAAAKKGVESCTPHIQPPEEEPEEEVDELDDFFNDVEEATTQVRKAKEEEAKPKSKELIKKEKKDLGTADEQIDRLLQSNYKWKNLNPFYVLDLDHSATADEISRRYKALSLLLHPDKNRSNVRAQEAYDEVLKAKATLADEGKANHARQLMEQGMIQGTIDWKKNGQPTSKGETETDYQSRASQRIFAQVEHHRRDVEQRERDFKQREQQQEDDELEKERNERKFNKEWKEENRVDKRIGNWRDFQTKKKKKP